MHAIDIGRRIHEARLARGYTQNESALRADMNLTVFLSYEKNHKQPGATNLRKICQALQVTSDWVIGLTDQMTDFDGNKIERERR